MTAADRHGEATRLYVTEAQRVFDALHEVATRLAGLLMSLEMLKSRPPAVAAHFHHHLTDALGKLTASLDHIDGRLAGLVAAGDPLPSLRSAWRDMEAASRAMPGFETVDFQQSCCALHIKPANSGGRHGRIFNLDS